MTNYRNGDDGCRAGSPFAFSRERERERERASACIVMESSHASNVSALLSKISSLISTISLQQSGLEKYLLSVQRKLFSVKAFSLGLLETKTLRDDTVSLLIQVEQLLLPVSVAPRPTLSSFSLSFSQPGGENERRLTSAFGFLDEVERSLSSEQDRLFNRDNLSQSASTSHWGELHPLSDDASKMISPIPQLAQSIMGFLNTSNRLKLVGIVGEGGIGKTTLLIHLLQVLQSKHFFSYIVFIDLVSDEPNDQALMHAQASMLLQLGGPVCKFKDLHHGRMALKERLHDLFTMGKSFCIAIDNVWRAQVLKKILSDTLSPSMSSSLMITSRICSIIDDLEDLCARNVPSIPFQVMISKHQPMQVSAARSLLLAQYTHITKQGLVNEQEKMLYELCRFCGGNPLVLKAAGCFLARAKCDISECCTKMMEETSWFTDSEIQLQGMFEISYKNLQSNSKEALCDIVSFLHEWKWDIVQNIVGVEAMEELTNFHLIKCVDQKTQASKIINADTISFGHGVIFMHEFIRKLALKKTTKDRAIRNLSILRSLDVRFLLDVKFVHLDGKVEDEKIPGRLFTGLERLTVLELYGSFQCSELLLPNGLLYFKLANNSATQLHDVQVPSSLRHFELEQYEELLELPISLYNCRNLQILRIYACLNLHGFVSVSNWHCLRILHLEACYGITQLPEDLEDLELLRLRNCTHLQALPTLPSKKVRVYIEGCPHLSPSSQVVTTTECIHDSNKVEETGLEDLPAIHLCRNVQKLSSALGQLKLHNCTCRKLEGLGLEEMKSLRKMKLEFCQNLVRLPDGICRLNSLVTLDVRGCLALEQLPNEIGQLSALKSLHLHDCQKLRRLPKSIGGLKSLSELSLIGCTDLEELPDEIEWLSSLREMQLVKCQKLRALPNGICNLSSLLQLDINSCENFQGLPRRIGNLSALQTLLLMECNNIRILPDSVDKLGSLSVLCLNECTHLEALPEKMGRLSNLTTLALAGCSDFTKLNKSICNLSLITMLDLQGCLHLESLPNEFGSNLGVLETVFLMDCRKLKSLPDSFCKLKSLKELDLSGCFKLEQLPHNFGELISLQKMRLAYCRVLKQLPESIYQLQSLVVMDLHGCYMLEKLPMDLGKLNALEELILLECGTLEVLPESVRNLKLLRELDMRGSGAELVLEAKGQLYFVGEERVKSFLIFWIELNKQEITDEGAQRAWICWNGGDTRTDKFGAAEAN